MFEAICGASNCASAGTCSMAAMSEVSVGKPQGGGGGGGGGGAPGAPSPPGGSPIPATAQGCACQNGWQANGGTCESYCCNPDDDARGDWCLVADHDGQGAIRDETDRAAWGYCAPAGKPQSPPPPPAASARCMDDPSCNALISNLGCAHDRKLTPTSLSLNVLEPKCSHEPPFPA
jgi:hypothetical protein